MFKDVFTQLISFLLVFMHTTDGKLPWSYKVERILLIANSSYVTYLRARDFHFLSELFVLWIPAISIAYSFVSHEPLTDDWTSHAST